MLHFEAVWHALGPFDIGTREDPWRDNVDFSAIEISDKLYPSSLCLGAFWKKIEFELNELEERLTTFNLELAYPEVHWQDLINTYGWAVTQFDAWIRGTIVVEQDCVVLLSIQNSPEFMLDKERYEGDIYASGVPLCIRLNKGRHILEVRLVNEVRIFGFQNEPKGTIVVRAEVVYTSCELLLSKTISAPGLLRLGSQVVNASTTFSITARNVSKIPIVLTGIKSLDLDIVVKAISNECHIDQFQSRQYCFVSEVSPWTHDLNLQISWELLGKCLTSEISIKLDENNITSFREPHIITYLEMNGTLGRAVLRAPLYSKHVPVQVATKLPVILALHGAGVDIAAPAWKNAFADAYDDAWILQPDCGRWGDDWHSLSWYSIWRALRTIPKWIESHQWHGAAADLDRILVIGHSNGGQGAMQFAMKYSDRILGAVSIAGYTSIQRYVPYTLWTSPALEHANLAKYDAIANIKKLQGIKFFLKHGVDDDNVPIYHSRVLARLLEDVELEEVPDEGHWWDSIMKTGRLRTFVEDLLQDYISGKAEAKPRKEKVFQNVFDSSVMLESEGPITIVDLDGFAQRLAHNFLQYYSLDCDIVQEKPKEGVTGTLITLAYASTQNSKCVTYQSPDGMGMEVTLVKARCHVDLTAANHELMSRLIRHLPWRTGVPSPAKLRIRRVDGHDEILLAENLP